MIIKTSSPCIQGMLHLVYADRKIVSNPNNNNDDDGVNEKIEQNFISNSTNHITFRTFLGLKAGPCAIFFCSSSSSTICCLVCSGGHLLSPLGIFNKIAKNGKHYYHFKLSFSSFELDFCAGRKPQIKNANCFCARLIWFQYGGTKRRWLR